MKTAVIQAQQKWECHHVTAYSETMLVSAVNEAGREGWEPFSATHYKDSRGTMSWIVLLKRPASGQPAQAVKAAGADVASPAAKPQDTVREPVGFDLEGDIFDLKKE